MDMTKVCQVIMERTVDDAIVAAKGAKQRGADMVEFRLDVLKNPTLKDLQRLKKSFPGNSIATVRTKAQGGAYSKGANTKDPSHLQDLIISAGFKYVDIELPLSKRKMESVNDALKRKLLPILSAHRLRTGPTGQTLGILGIDAKTTIRCVMKQVFEVSDTNDWLGLQDQAKGLVKIKQKHITLATGRYSWPQRMFSNLFGSELCFSASLDECSLLGLPETATLRSAIRSLKGFKGIPRNFYALLGADVSRSPSPDMFNSIFLKQRSDAAYLPYSLKPTDFYGLMKDPLAFGISGGNMTMPYKVSAMGYAGRTTRDCERAGCANTFLSSGMQMHNTDVAAMRTMLEGCAGNALLMGTGGAAKAAAVALAENMIGAYVWDRKERNANGFASSFGFEPIIELGSEHFDIVINATPLKARKESAFYDRVLKLVPMSDLVIDAVYSIKPTALLAAACASKVRHRSGADMLLLQGREAYKFMTGKDEPGLMAKVLKKRWFYATLH